MRSRAREPGIGQGPHARWWAARMGEAARRADATIVISPHQRSEAIRLLGLDPALVHLLPDGVDVERFAVRRGDEGAAGALARMARARSAGLGRGERQAGQHPLLRGRGRAAFFDAGTGEPRPVLMYVGRFLGFKRVPLLVRAYARARARMSVPAPLVIWGGAPGEWEGEHPHTVATREGVDGVFFAGWRGHDDLPLGLGCADCFVAPSTDEPFGLVYLEAMACGLPVIGTLSGGPPSFVDVVPGEPDGWLVPPDDEEALADAMVRAVDDAGERDAGAARTPPGTCATATRGTAWRAASPSSTTTWEPLPGHPTPENVTFVTCLTGRSGLRRPCAMPSRQRRRRSTTSARKTSSCSRAPRWSARSSCSARRTASWVRSSRRSRTGSCSIRRRPSRPIPRSWNPLRRPPGGKRRDSSHGDGGVPRAESCPWCMVQP